MHEKHSKSGAVAASVAEADVEPAVVLRGVVRAGPGLYEFWVRPPVGDSSEVGGEVVYRLLNASEVSASR